MCPLVISCGSHGISRLHVWVDKMCLPSWRVILMGFLVGSMLMTGAMGRMKCPVVPESEMAWFDSMAMFAWCFVESCFVLVQLLVITVASLSSSSAERCWCLL